MKLPEVFYLDRSDRGRLLLTGRDRQSFLQGMVTNDVASLKPGEGCYAFLLDATGHVLADARIRCLEDALLLDVEPGMAAVVAETLDKYLIMERVKIRDVSDEYAQITIGGLGAPEYLSALLETELAGTAEGVNAVVRWVGGDHIVARSEWLALPTFDIYIKDWQNRDAALSILSNEAVELPSSDFEVLRIEAGIPRFGTDMDARTLAPETGQQKRAIHYRKGCYIGQEIVARIDARGHVNRGLVGFLLGGDVLPAPETPVSVEGKEVGRITSTTLSPHLGRPIALGYLRREHSEPGTTVEIAGVSATVASLPFVTLP